MFLSKCTKIFSDESGVSLVEYCLIAALVAVGAIAALDTIGGNLVGTLETIGDQVGGAG